MRLLRCCGLAAALCGTMGNASVGSDDTAQLQLARWDVLLNDAGREAVNQAGGKVIKDSGTGYHATIFDADALRGAVAQAKDTGGLLASGDMSMSQHIPMDFINELGGSNLKAALNGRVQGSESSDNAGSASMHLKLDYTKFSLNLYERVGARFLRKLGHQQETLEFDGSLTAGQAVAMMADYRGGKGSIYHHMIVWEVFKEDPGRMAQYARNIDDPSWWAENGPDGFNSAIDTATVWRAGAKDDALKPSPAWERKLEDGKTLRVVALTRLDKWPFCWWNPDGQPVEMQQVLWLVPNALQNPLWSCVELVVPPDQTAREFPTGKPPIGQNQVVLKNLNKQYVYAESLKQFTVGAAVGPWKKAGEVAVGATITVDELTFQIREATPSGDNGFYLQFRYRSGGSPTPPIEIVITAVDQNGSEYNPNFFSAIFSEGEGRPVPQYRGISLDKVKGYRMYKRKIQWVTFDHLMAEPPTPPRMDVKPGEVAAAEKIIAERGDRR